MKHVRINTAAELRTLLAESICAVMEGRMNVSQANSVVGLSGEIHKSIRQEWDMRVYTAENLTYCQAKIVNHVLDADDKEIKALGDGDDEK